MVCSPWELQGWGLLGIGEQVGFVETSGWVGPAWSHDLGVFVPDLPSNT